MNSATMQPGSAKKYFAAILAFGIQIMIPASLAASPEELMRTKPDMTFAFYYALSICDYITGRSTKDESYERLERTTLDLGLSYRQFSNFIARDSIKKLASQFIDDEGGCQGFYD